MKKSKKEVPPAIRRLPTRWVHLLQQTVPRLVKVWLLHLNFIIANEGQNNKIFIYLLGCLWTLCPAKATKMDEEVLKWSRKDPSAIKRAMAYPGKRYASSHSYFYGSRN